MRKSEIDAEKKPELEGPEFWVKETSQEEETQQNQQVEKQDRQGEIEGREGRKQQPLNILNQEHEDRQI